MTSTITPLEVATSHSVRSRLVLVLVWNLGTELLRPLVGQPNYQFVERAGDDVLPLVLFSLAGAAPLRTAAARLGNARRPLLSAQDSGAQRVRRAVAGRRSLAG